MLGLVFTELIELIEEKFSIDVAEQVLMDVGAEHGGAYTAVGRYDHAELVALVQALSRRSGLPVSSLVRTFGTHLLHRFTVLYPELFEGKADLFDFLASIDSHIHVEVSKLYEHAQLPRFQVLSRTPARLELLYTSARSMEELALGLLEGAVAHYAVDAVVTSRSHGNAEGLPAVVFEILRTPSR